ncbi:hypothetical protein CTU88_34540 [Streptomyces sp. JV178]|uniref:hypothetical protein n=1 Tax=Streptomyces sp. JV178 TaxID=858632 RepID=UPI000C1B43AB|nr:hypothetical protein [Streptomyces sp. JV178]PIM67876.1 hypothetical protein CTU88_34540 [Streptomyces sp. JV178]
MRTRLQWTHGRGERVAVARGQTYLAEIVLKVLVVVGLLYMPVLVFHFGTWLPFAGAGLYLLWELGRLSSALGELAALWNEQHQPRPEPARSVALK